MLSLAMCASRLLQSFAVHSCIVQHYMPGQTRAHPTGLLHCTSCCAHPNPSGGSQRASHT